jgi:hypothetical protein
MRLLAVFSPPTDILVFCDADDEFKSLIQSMVPDEVRFQFNS